MDSIHEPGHAEGAYGPVLGARRFFEDLAPATDDFPTDVLESFDLPPDGAPGLAAEGDQAARGEQQFAYREKAEHGVESAHPFHFAPDIDERLLGRFMDALHEIGDQHPAEGRQAEE